MNAKDLYQVNYFQVKYNKKHENSCIIIDSI